MIEPAQEQLATINQCRIGSQSIENTSELDSDIASAVNEKALWELRQVEYGVGVDHMFAARNIRAPRPTAYRNKDRFGTVCLAVHLDVMIIDDMRSAFDRRNARVVQQALVDPVQA